MGSLSIYTFYTSKLAGFYLRRAGNQTKALCVPVSIMDQWTQTMSVRIMDQPGLCAASSARTMISAHHNLVGMSSVFVQYVSVSAILGMGMHCVAWAMCGYRSVTQSALNRSVTQSALSLQTDM